MAEESCRPGRFHRPIQSGLYVFVRKGSSQRSRASLYVDGSVRLRRRRQLPETPGLTPKNREARPNRGSPAAGTRMETERAVFLEYQMSGGRLAVVFAILAFSVPLAAHHGTGGIYDMEKPVTLKGTVTAFKLVNPHVLVSFDVPDKKGVVNWLGEGPSVIDWTRRGWNRNSVK